MSKLNQKVKEQKNYIGKLKNNWQEWGMSKTEFKAKLKKEEKELQNIKAIDRNFTCNEEYPPCF